MFYIPDVCARTTYRWPVTRASLYFQWQLSDLLIRRSVFCLSLTIASYIQLEGSELWSLCVDPFTKVQLGPISETIGVALNKKNWVIGELICS